MTNASTVRTTSAAGPARPELGRPACPPIRSDGSPTSGEGSSRRTRKRGRRNRKELAIAHLLLAPRIPRGQNDECLQCREHRPKESLCYPRPRWPVEPEDDHATSSGEDDRWERDGQHDNEQ